MTIGDMWFIVNDLSLSILIYLCDKTSINEDAKQ